MPQPQSRIPLLIIFTFLLVLAMDWVYVYVVRAQPQIIVNGWFYLFPLMTFFYCAFAFIALLGLIYRNKQGLMLAFAVLLFGALSTAISYILTSNSLILLQQMFIVVGVINALQMLFMAMNTKYYR